MATPPFQRTYVETSLYLSLHTKSQQECRIKAIEKVNVKSKGRKHCIEFGVHSLNKDQMWCFLLMQALLFFIDSTNHKLLKKVQLVHLMNTV